MASCKFESKDVDPLDVEGVRLVRVVDRDPGKSRRAGQVPAGLLTMLPIQPKMNDDCFLLRLNV